MKTITKCMVAALLLSLAAPGQAQADSCVDTKQLVKAELAVQEMVLDECFAKKGSACKAALDYTAAKSNAMQALLGRYLSCVVELTLADPEGTRKLSHTMDRVTEKMGRMVKIVENKK